MYEEVMRFYDNKKEFTVKSKEVIKILEETKKMLEGVEVNVITWLLLPTQEAKEMIIELNEKLEELNKELGEF